MDTGQLYDAARHWLTSGAWMHTARAAVAAALIMTLAIVLSHLLQTTLHRLRGRVRLGGPLIYIVEKLGGYAILVVGGLAAISRFGIDLGSLTLFGGALGVGMGLGLQGVVKEFVSGVVLIFDPTIQVGDFVEIESIRGEVAEIGPRATRLRTNDNLNVMIPNSVLMQSRVINWTYNEASRRFHIPFSVAETSDKAVVRAVVIAAARALPFTLPDDDVHKTQVWLTGFRGDGLEFNLVVWPTLDSSRHPRTMQAAYTWAIHEALRIAGIANASPQVDISLNQLAGREDKALALLKLLERRPRARATARKRTVRAPNDAAQAMFDDAHRERQQRAEAARQREPPSDPDASDRTDASP